MCKCKAFYYRGCRRDHVKFEQVSTCVGVRLGLSVYCPNRIVNAVDGGLRAWPAVDETCPECFPDIAAAAAAEAGDGKGKGNGPVGRTATTANE